VSCWLFDCVTTADESSSSDDDDDDDNNNVDNDVVTKVSSKPHSKTSRQPASTTAPGSVMHIRRAFTRVIEQGLPTFLC